MINRCTKATGVSGHASHIIETFLITCCHEWVLSCTAARNFILSSTLQSMRIRLCCDIACAQLSELLSSPLPHCDFQLSIHKNYQCGASLKCGKIYLSNLKTQQMNVIFQKLNIQIIFMVSDLKSCFWDKTSEESQLLKVMFRCHLLVV